MTGTKLTATQVGQSAHDVGTIIADRMVAKANETGEMVEVIIPGGFLTVSTAFGRERWLTFDTIAERIETRDRAFAVALLGVMHSMFRVDLTEDASPPE